MDNIVLNSTNYSYPPSLDLKLGRLQLEKQLVWGAAIDYLSRIEMQKIHSYEVS